MEAKRYSSVSKMLHDLSSDEQFNSEFDSQVSQRRLLKNLISLRCTRDVSQLDVADVIGVSQSRVSKIENGIDDDLKFGDLKAYARACGMDLEIVFRDRKTTIVDHVKYHAFRIKHFLDLLARFAERDEAIAKGAASFFGEAFFNVVKLMQDSASNLPKRKRDGRPHICIQVRELPVQDEEAFCLDCDFLEDESDIPEAAVAKC